MMKSFITAIIVPVGVICADMFYSDTTVIVSLSLYIHSFLNQIDDTRNSSSVRHSPKLNSRSAGNLLVVILAFLCIIYTFSLTGFFHTPILKYLKIAYRTRLNLAEEDANEFTPIGMCSDTK